MAAARASEGEVLRTPAARYDFSSSAVTGPPDQIGPLFDGAPPRAQHNASPHSFTPSRDQRTKRARPPPLDVDLKLSELVQANKKIYKAFLKQHTCYDIMPVSSKIVIFDTKLKVKKAFFALVQNNVRSAPLWDSSRQQFVGMITITDFIQILRKYYRTPLEQIEELEEHRIETWKQPTKGGHEMVLLSISPAARLYDAVHMLVGEKIHRLPVIDGNTGNALTILTHKRILLFLYLNVLKSPEKPLAIMDLTIERANLGTFQNIATISEDTPLIIALNIFVERRVSALPIVDSNGVVVDIYAKFDCINLAREKSYNNLDVTVKEALDHRQDFEGVQTCRLSDTVGQITEKIVVKNVHRLVIVDHETRLMGILSLSDLLKFLVL